MKNNKIDWQIHAVYKDPEGPFDIHTHGLEKHGLRNICMTCPTKDLVNYCSCFINNLASSMIDGERYSVNTTHVIDNKYNMLEVYDVFNLLTDFRDEEPVLVVDYWFNKEYINRETGTVYKFNSKNLAWEIIKRIRL